MHRVPNLQMPFQNSWERTQACAISSDPQTWYELNFGESQAVLKTSTAGSSPSPLATFTHWSARPVPARSVT